MRLTQSINRFQQTGLTRSIGPGNKVYAWIEVDRGALQIPEIGQAKLTDCHHFLLRVSGKVCLGYAGIEQSLLDQENLPSL